MANWFIGLPVDPGMWFAELPAPPRGVRLFHPEDLHVTVAFLGSVDEAAARRAFERARDFPRGALAISLGAVVPMGRPSRPSALSALLAAGTAEMSAAIGSVRDEMAALAGAPRDERPVRPHVTLARTRRDAPRQEREEAVAWASALNLGQPWVRVTSLGLYTWAASPSERRFRILEAAGL